MPIEVGQIIKNLIPSESVTVNQIQPLGAMVSIKFTGVNSQRANSKVISKEEFDSLEALTKEGTFNFKGDPKRFALFAEAERINSAYQFDPLFAVNCSIVDPLPHQVEAVYKFLLPLPKIRFLLADDTGAEIAPAVYAAQEAAASAVFAPYHRHIAHADSRAAAAARESPKQSSV